MADEILKLAIPREGKLYAPTADLLSSCGIPVEWEGERRYTAHMPTLPEVEVVATRGDTTYKAVEMGAVDLGILGQDQFLEVHSEEGESLIILDDLGFGHCGLWMAAPDSLTRVTCIDDLAELASELGKGGKQLRIATKYPSLVQGFLDQRGVSDVTLIHASGTLETFPVLGLSDLVADIVSSGTTLRENGLRKLEDGWIQNFQACLIGNRSTLRTSEAKLAKVQAFLERIEAFLRAQNSFIITANVPGDSPEVIANQVMHDRELSGLRGPTISPVYSLDGVIWFSVTLVVSRPRLLDAVNHLRQMGGDGFLVQEAPYIFQGDCISYQTLLQALR